MEKLQQAEGGNSLPFLKIGLGWTTRMMIIDFTCRNFQAAGMNPT